MPEISMLRFDIGVPPEMRDVLATYLRLSGDATRKQCTIQVRACAVGRRTPIIIRVAEGPIMSISVTCVCGRPFEAADDQAGKTIQCSECGRVVTVPGNVLIVQPISLPPARSWKAVGALLLGLGSLTLWIVEPV